MRTIRLWLMPALGGDQPRVDALERSDAALARPRRVGGRVWDVSGAKSRDEAERMLRAALSAQPAVEEDPDEWARVAAARARVREVEVTRG